MKPGTLVHLRDYGNGYCYVGEYVGILNIKHTVEDECYVIKMLHWKAGLKGWNAFTGVDNLRGVPVDRAEIKKVYMSEFKDDLPPGFRY